MEGCKRVVMSVELVAERPGQLLFRDEKTDLGITFDVEQNEFTHPLPFQSILSRGYWTEPSDIAIRLAGVLTIPSKIEEPSS